LRTVNKKPNGGLTCPPERIVMVYLKEASEYTDDKNPKTKGKIIDSIIWSIKFGTDHWTGDSKVHSHLREELPKMDNDALRVLLKCFMLAYEFEFKPKDEGLIYCNLCGEGHKPADVGQVYGQLTCTQCADGMGEPLQLRGVH